MSTKPSIKSVALDIVKVLAGALAAWLASGCC